MKLLPPDLLEQLAHSRLLPLDVRGHTGVGERKSRTTGPGIEFADHRPYQPGDDTRFLDRHAFARLGEYHVRHFTTYGHAPVRLLLDASASMGRGRGSKLEMSARLTAALACAAVAGGDATQVGIFREGVVEWHPPVRHLRRAHGLFEWLADVQGYGHTQLGPLVTHLASVARPPGILAVVSDWLDADAERAIDAWQAAGYDLAITQVLAPEETSPELIGSGPVELVDAETGDVTEVALGDHELKRYFEELSSWMDGIQAAAQRGGARYSFVRSDMHVARDVLPQWRSMGLIG